MSNQTLVSIVVTTKNEEKNIAHCLQSIKEQTYPHIEIIVVDNHSTDKTVEIAKKYTPYVYLKGPERSAQRNYGMIEKAHGKYVMYIDADMILSPSLIEACVSWMESKNTIALHIPEIVLGTSYWSRVRRFERRFYDGTVIDGARFFRKDIFQKVGGFDENFSGPEDWDLDKKIKQEGNIDLLQAEENLSIDFSLWNFIQEKGISPPYPFCCIYHNESEFSLPHYLKKKTYYTQNFAPYIQKWGKNDPDLKKQFGLWYRYVGVFIENGKWKYLFKHPILAFGMYFLRFLVGIVFLTKRRKKQGSAIMKKHILLLSPTFPPDVGGVETHMSDIVKAFQKYSSYRVSVSTYKPIVTKNIKTYQKKEVIGKITIYRHWWFKNLFHILEHYPFLQFLYLVPYLFFRTLLLCQFKIGKPDVIYAHGLSSALIAKWLKYIYKKTRIVVATHAIYEMSPQSLIAKFTKWILQSADTILCLSEGSRKELHTIGLDKKKIHRFHYWLQLENFPPIEKKKAKKYFDFSPSQFIILFVGRLIAIKGFKLLWEVAKEMQEQKDIVFWFVGTGPEEDFLLNNPLPNMTFWGKQDNTELYKFYNAADVFCIPSLYEEGFGRVILEALACGTPVIGSKKGGIPEVVTQEVGIVIEPTKENFINAILTLKNDNNLYKKLQKNTRPYIEKYYSEKNFEEILSHLDPEFKP